MVRSSIDGPRRALVALLLVGFVGLKAFELIGRVESWPLTRMPMFSRYRGPAETPWSVRLEGLHAGRWRTVEARELVLTPDEMLRRLAGDAEAISHGCGRLWRSFNATRAPRARVAAMRARVVRVARPGVSESPGPAEVVLPCR